MTRRLLFILPLFLFIVSSASPQTTDTSSVLGSSDTASLVQSTYVDSIEMQKYLAIDSYRSFLLTGGQNLEYDVQQLHLNKRDMSVFLLLMLMLCILTYVKVAFSKDIEELFQSFANSGISQQIFRTQSGETSVSSFLLHVNFIVALSIYVQIILANHFQQMPFKNFSSVMVLIFLFTFFYITKILVIKFIGAVFELNEECGEYIYHFSIVCKMIGLALIPALFFFHATQEKFFKLFFITTILISIVFVFVFVWRGLSTGYKLLYRSMYHFFIYVCVVEISTIFLLFKLLTKTIT
ncbi:MAG: DUF4271 domain-containing protein [Bacteroidota bacterium]